MSTLQPQLPTDIAKRPLHFFWLVDWSGSMEGKKIASLNQAIREALPDIHNATANHAEVQIWMRAIKFADKAEWHVGPQPMELDKFFWPELGIDGHTATAQAIRLLSSELDLEKMPRRGFPPVCILVSDGCCTDPEEDYAQAIADLEALPWGKRAVRLAIAVGDEAEYDEEQLLQFVSHKEIGVLKAHNPAELVQHIKWASTTATVGTTVGKSQLNNSANIILPVTPPPVVNPGPGEVF
jgi:uncharacterized protein YegL